MERVTGVDKERSDEEPEQSEGNRKAYVSNPFFCKDAKKGYCLNFCEKSSLRWRIVVNLAPRLAGSNSRALRFCVALWVISRFASVTRAVTYTVCSLTRSLQNPTSPHTA